MGKKYFIITFFLAAGFYTAAAEDNFNLAKARLLAVSASNELAKASEGLSAAELQKAALKYSWYPDISVSSSYRYSDNGTIDDYTPSASVSLQQQLWDGGVYSAKKKIESADSAIALHEWENTILTVKKECDTLYYSYIEALSRENTAKAAYEAAEALRSSSLAKYESGIIAHVSYLQMRSDAASKETEYLAANQSALIAENNLTSYLGLDALPSQADTDIPAYEKYLDAVTTYSKSKSAGIPEKLFFEGLKNSPVLKNSEKLLQQKEFEKSLKIREYNPMVSLSASRTYSGDEIEGVVQNSSITLSASFTLSQWDRANRLKQADISISTAAHTLAESNHKYKLDTESAWFNLVSSAQSAYSAAIAAEYAAEYYSEIYERYQLSAETVSSLKDAESGRIKAGNAYIAIKFDFLKNLSELVYMTGLSDDEQLIAILVSE